MSVLVGFAPTPEGRAAVERAVGECRLRGSVLTIMVSQPRQLRPADTTHLVDTTQLTAVGTTATREPATGPRVTGADLDALLAEFGAADLERRLHDADPLLDLADQMLDLAEDAGVELIVIGLRRRSPAGKLILGSAAQRIMLEASCPVLAVKVDHRSTTSGREVAAGTA